MVSSADVSEPNPVMNLLGELIKYLSDFIPSGSNSGLAEGLVGTHLVILQNSGELVFILRMTVCIFFGAFSPLLFHTYKACADPDVVVRIARCTLDS